MSATSEGAAGTEMRGGIGLGAGLYDEGGTKMGSDMHGAGRKTKTIESEAMNTPR